MVTVQRSFSAYNDRWSAVNLGAVLYHVSIFYLGEKIVKIKEMPKITKYCEIAMDKQRGICS